MKKICPAMSCITLVLAAVLSLTGCESSDNSSMTEPIHIETDVPSTPGTLDGAWGGLLNEIGMGLVLVEGEAGIAGVYQDREGWQGTIEGTRTGNDVTFTSTVTNGMDVALIAWNGTVNDELTELSGTYLIREGSGSGFGSDWSATKFEDQPAEEQPAEEQPAEENPQP